MSDSPFRDASVGDQRERERAREREREREREVLLIIKK
jgi:hypothetical protein